ncbi:zinc finger, C4 type [Ancylostoma duodenale]|uniref:Zinc finger, C4 type n=1 Tax=Ancylostoma duodenale TaxID=51022 RepID=A0A0C2HI09_9BILA|nr:zinc finger, C4 type [Ancylostoma duodenale]
MKGGSEEFSTTTLLCQVCSDKASGFHYGVFACEGCKVSARTYACALPGLQQHNAIASVSRCPRHGTGSGWLDGCALYGCAFACHHLSWPPRTASVHYVATLFGAAKNAE